MCLLWCGDRPCGGPGTHDRSARSSPLVVAYFAAYLTSVLTSLGILWLHGRANAPVVVVVPIFVAIVVAIPSGVLWMKQRGIGSSMLGQAAGRRRPPLLKAIAEAPTGLLHDPVLLAETVTLEFAVSALDALDPMFAL
jgi:hypothetical protein